MAAPAPATATATATATSIRVASVPSSHVYIQHIGRAAESMSGAVDGTTDGTTGGAVEVTRLPDPHPTEPGRSAVSVWWPPRMLDPRWVAENSATFDVFHVQFGFDASTPADLAALARELRSAGKPFVYTAHDLRNPHHFTSAEHDAQLAVIMAQADAVITLTDGAANEIFARWGRTATVIPHPHVVDFATMDRTRSTREPRLAGAPLRVGLHVKSMRANMNPLPLVRALAETAHEHPNTVIQVDGHPDVLEPDGARYDVELSSLLKQYDRRGIIDLRVHDFFTDEELWRYLAELDASILPYRFGTHSGWLEACRDLGTEVIAPTCGYYQDQGPVHLYRNDDSGFDADSLVDAVAEVSGTDATSALTTEFRMSQRNEIAARHESLYSELLA